MKKYQKIILSTIITSSIFFSNTLYAEFEPHKSTKKLYDFHESLCIKKGWQKVTITEQERVRHLLWKNPEKDWANGVIILLHGGGGTFSNYCSNIRLGKPMVEFAELALENGFAVFSLDSTFGAGVDQDGNSCEKRWDAVAHPNWENADLRYIKKVIDEIIPEKRPLNSSKNVFMAGISNGGFMTVLFASQFSDRITAFASLSAGDPYGSHMDCQEGLYENRRSAHGAFRDNDSKKDVSKINACASWPYAQEEIWPKINKKIPYKLFHHQGDGACDFSCMERVQYFLDKTGFINKGNFIIKSKKRRILYHFWNRKFNKPLIEYFLNNGGSNEYK